MRKLVFFFIASLLFVSFTACKSTKTEANGNSANTSQVNTMTEKGELLVAISKTPCFGTCPHFDFVMYESGYCTYDGKNFVEMEGLHEALVSKAEYDVIKEIALSIDYFNMEDEYKNQLVMDLPSTSTTVVYKKKTKTVFNYYGGPKELVKLYEVIDALIEKAEWHKIKDEMKSE